MLRLYDSGIWILRPRWVLPPYLLASPIGPLRIRRAGVSAGRERLSLGGIQRSGGEGGFAAALYADVTRSVFDVGQSCPRTNGSAVDGSHGDVIWKPLLLKRKSMSSLLGLMWERHFS